MLHSHADAPSGWIQRWAPLIARGGRVLDVAAGSGRHARWLASRGHRVDALDRDQAALSAFESVPGVTTLCADIENGPWPCERAAYAGVVVANYLHRPLFGEILAALAPGGILIYETFAAGNERFGRPSNPAFLLEPGELLDVVRGRLRVVAYEALQIDDPKPAMVQRICGEAGG